jgi:hypothetical protein
MLSVQVYYERDALACTFMLAGYKESALVAPPLASITSAIDVLLFYFYL